MKLCAPLSLSYRRPEVVLTQIDVPVEATMRQVEVIRGLSIQYDMQVFQKMTRPIVAHPTARGAMMTWWNLISMAVWPIGPTIIGDAMIGSVFHYGLNDFRGGKRCDGEYCHVLAAVNQYESYTFTRGEPIDHEEEPRTSAEKSPSTRATASSVGSNRRLGLLLAFTGRGRHRVNACRASSECCVYYVYTNVFVLLYHCTSFQ